MENLIEEELIVGQYVLIDYKSGGIEAFMICRSPKIYHLDKIKSVDGKQVWLQSGNGAELNSLIKPNNKIIKKYELYMKFYDDATKKYPPTYSTADQECDYCSKMHQIAIKKFIKESNKK